MHYIVLYLNLKGYINTKLHNTIPKCLQTKNPANVGLDVVNYSSSSDKTNSSLSGVL